MVDGWVSRLLNKRKSEQQKPSEPKTELARDKELKSSASTSQSKAARVLTEKNTIGNEQSSFKGLWRL